jgi:UDP-glucose 4-epimerase
LNSDPVLITGGAGFIGRTLTRRLTELGCRTVVVDRDPAGGALPAGVEVRRGDIRDATFMRAVLVETAPRVLFHLAAIHFIPDCERDPVECVSVNTGGAMSVLEACARMKQPPLCVLASTAAVYAPAETAHSETETPGPIDVYGMSKVWLEQIAALYAKKHGFQIWLARLFNVYGPGETNPHLIPSLIDQALAGGLVQVGDLSTRRDYVHVRDVADALVAMAGTRAASDGISCVNVGTGHAVSGTEVVGILAAALGRQVETATDAARLRRVDRPVMIANPSRAAELLGWRARIPFEAGMRELVGESVSAGARV